MPRPITVRLIGGLGNQLFGYYAGAALAGLRGAPLRLDTSWTRHGITDHGIAIRDLDLPGDWPAEGRRGRLLAPGTLGGRATSKAVREIPALARMLRVYEASAVGHDPSLLQQPAGTRLRGYFQSWRIVSTALDFGYPRRPELRERSEWLDRMVERAAAERPISVHVRRGDYAKVAEFGLLGGDYYDRALAHLRERGIDGPVWIFSDDPAAAREIVDGEIVSADSPGPAAELLAMSHARAHVIANSTFSWWGAWMNAPRTPVVAPEPWFAAGPSIEGLIPPEWDRLPAG